MVRTTMKLLEIRVATLEKARADRQASAGNVILNAQKAIGLLRLERLFSAYGAERVGRPLTKQEVNARRLFNHCLREQCRYARLPVPTIDDKTFLEKADIAWISLH